LTSWNVTDNSSQVTGWIDQGLNEKAYIIPGLGDFGERRYVIHPSSVYALLKDLGMPMI
jgi:hypothetical protein